MTMLRSHMSRLGRWLGIETRTSRDIRDRAAALIREADTARDAERFRDAASSYATALKVRPGIAAIHVQAGHMFKEARDLEAAAEHYAAAEALMPDDAELQLQIGHFHRTADRLELAARHYERAAALAPDWPEPRRDHAAVVAEQAARVPLADAPLPMLVPRPIEPQPTAEHDVIVFRHFGGRHEATPVGLLPVLSGVEAIRGVCFSKRRLVEATVAVDGVVLAREPIASFVTADAVVAKAVFNLWLDVSAITPGVHRLDIALAEASGRACRRSERILIAAAPQPDAWPDSDATVILAPGDPRCVTEQVRALPSMVRAVARRLMPQPDTILVLRTDQLGDLVISIPALVRLRALFPAARLVGLLTVANVDLARSLALFDEVIVIDFPDDPVRRQRTMEPDAQRALQASLVRYRFDVAIDLATSNMSRPLLRLAGARFTFGFDDGASPWLDGGISGNILDPRNGGNVSPQSGRVLALVERLGTLFASAATVVPCPDLDRARLVELGLPGNTRFVVFHTGARVRFSRWPHFAALAEAVLARHDVSVVLLAEQDADVVESALLLNERLIVVDRHLPFGDLDALLSGAAALVGNDSGPKHLAALRGTPVVSIHCARINWAEWCQEQTGVVISRKVPCAGCAIFHDAEECGKDFACVTDIGVDEVLREVDKLLFAPSTTRSAT